MLQGGIKVLVAGPWSGESAAHYSILFNCKAVPTELVQTGLLRCFSPRHSPGLVSLQVSCNDVIISKAVSFEYRQRDASIKTHSRTLGKLVQDYEADYNTLAFNQIGRVNIVIVLHHLLVAPLW